jgi:hypothetical protein
MVNYPRFRRGRASDRGFRHEQIRIGARIERKEHRVPWPIASKIAKDHLYEDRNYYRKSRKCNL